MSQDESLDVLSLEDTDFGSLHGFRGVLNGLGVKKGMFAQKALGAKDMKGLLFSLTGELIDLYFPFIDDV